MKLAAPRTRRLEDCRILFCPHEIGGQMQLMVEELRRRGYHATAATYSQEWFGHVNDIMLQLDKTSSRAGKHARSLGFAAWASANYDIFHFFWGQSLYGLSRVPHLDLPVLRALGKRIFVHFRGIELVDLAYFDYLRAKGAGDDVPEPPMSRPDQLRSLAAWRRWSHRLLVSEPDLLRVAHEATMVQQAVDLSVFNPESRRPKSQDDGIIRIAHAPSMRRKKGTEFVTQSIEELKSLGYKVELVLIEKLPFHRVKELYAISDIGIDQVLYGWYGKVSIELMAMGLPTVCYIAPDLAPFRPDCPIVNADRTTLTERLKFLIDHPEERAALSQRGLAYVRQYHDVRAIIDQCLDLYRASFDA
jgi:hypothetical protein